MKEKIGIEKEIELNIKLHNLFKEYIENYGGDTKSADSLDYVVIDDGQAFLYGQRTYLYETLISKKFGMVKWLVENDKIDFSKVKEKIGLDRELYDGMLYWYKEDDFLIMILSVENEPIRFLCEILK